MGGWMLSFWDVQDVRVLGTVWVGTMLDWRGRTGEVRLGLVMGSVGVGWTTLT